ncbi:NUDIX domain-containing protein [Nocardia puris]|nr:NUDIX domain-containing protein [Nocardia puris]
MYLRDDKTEIAYPNQWSLLGGMIEAGETPLETIVREIDEEIGVVLDPSEVDHVCTRDLHFGVEHTFHARVSFEIEDVVLTEGQGLRWFTEQDAAATDLAYEDNAMLADFFAGLPETTTATQ